MEHLSSTSLPIGVTNHIEIDSVKRKLEDGDFVIMVTDGVLDALPVFVSKKSVDLFTKNGVYTESEMMARYDILLENYYKTLNIEALTMISMVKNDIMGSACSYQRSLAETISAKKAALTSVSCETEEAMLVKASDLTSALASSLKMLEEDVEKESVYADVYDLAKYNRDVIFEDMGKLQKRITDKFRLAEEEHTATVMRKNQTSKRMES